MSIVVKVPLSPDAASDVLPDAVSYVERDDTRVVLIRDGEPVAAVVSIHDLQVLEELDDADDAHWNKIADEANARWEAEGRPAGIPIEEIAGDLGIDLNDTE
jgi:hypothetical protein